MAAGTNRFNRLSSKEWLPFQKSWFRYSDSESLIRSNMRFFTFKEESELPVFYYGPEVDIAGKCLAELGFPITSSPSQPCQFALLDLRIETAAIDPADWKSYRKNILDLINTLSVSLVHRRFLAIAISNIQIDGAFYPWAWDLASRVGQLLSLKDEKIGGMDFEHEATNNYYHPGGGHFYMLYFRKDENSGVHQTLARDYSNHNTHEPTGIDINYTPPSWFILKPQRRKKNEVVHPAKFPEDLAEMFINAFTRPGENVFDPMSGTGSTQVAALKLGRNGFGVELSSYFTDIARERCLAYLFEASANSGKETGQEMPSFDIIRGDARKAGTYGFPVEDLIFTSPPYWDMLNMKGAENQAKRLQQGLQTNYSDDEKDLGNISDYQDFVTELVKIYFNLADMLKSGGHFIIVVKNIKKKGRNYPFAWDLAALLQQKLILMPEAFWCQDDLSIAPYGYGNTFVSNTFHQYCLCFRKP
jgi:DNA modification methylase